MLAFGEGLSVSAGFHFVEGWGLLRLGQRNHRKAKRALASSPRMAQGGEEGSGSRLLGTAPFPQLLAM
jgi:hypothetical protein